MTRTSTIVCAIVLGAAGLWVGHRIPHRAHADRAVGPVIECGERTTSAGRDSTQRDVPPLLAQLAQARQPGTAIVDTDPKTADVVVIAELSRRERDDDTRERRARVKAEIEHQIDHVSPATLDFILSQNDVLNRTFRNVRADYLQGKINEDEYVDGMRVAVYELDLALKERLTDDELRQMGRNRDSDPFDSSTWLQDPGAQAPSKNPESGR